ncbi:MULTISPECIES: hypothetical protein [unclassified Stenotrophomonas]|uniref:hypothetical protein n=1 Tax=unclassified Stenotrophomonas TaxID=196198 RepID=UPI003012B42A
MADPYNAGQALGSALFGSTQDTYTNQLGRQYQVEQALQQARQARSKAILAQQVNDQRALVNPELVSGVLGGDQDALGTLGSIALLANDNFDASQLSDVLGAAASSGARNAALAGDYNGANAQLFALAKGPQQLASVEGQNLLGNRFLVGGGDVSTTEQGRAGMAADAARARASDASAASSYASAARTRQGMALDRADVLGGGGRPSSKAPSGYRWKADGSLEAIPGGPADITGTLGDPTAKATEGERSAAGFLQRMVQSEAELEELRAGGYNAANLRDFYTAGEGTFLNQFASDKGQVNRQQQEDWVRAKLRKESGAVIGDEEMDREIKTYFPQPGDSQAVLQSKGRSRERAITQMRITAGRAASLGDRPPPAAAPAARPGLPAPAGGVDDLLGKYGIR